MNELGSQLVSWQSATELTLVALINNPSPLINIADFFSCTFAQKEGRDRNALWLIYVVDKAKFAQRPSALLQNNKSMVVIRSLFICIIIVVDCPVFKHLIFFVFCFCFWVVFWTVVAVQRPSRRLHRRRRFFTHLPVQRMGPNHTWPLVIENWVLF